MTLGAEGQGMVAGDLVNTASRDPVGRRAGHGARRRGDAARDRGGDRLRGRRRARAEGQGGAASRSGARCASSPARAGALKSAGLEAPFVGRDRELRLVKDLFHASAEERKRAPGLGHRHRRHRQVPARVGVLQVLRRPRRRRLLAPRPLPRLRRGRRRTGRSPRWCGCAPASPRTRSRRRRARSSARRSSEHVLDARGAALASSRASRTCSGSRSAPPRDRRTSSRPGGCSSSGWPTLARRARLRGHAVGGRGAARLHRVPARVVAQPPALRAHARAGPSCSSAARPGARASATSRSLYLEPLLARGDGGAARRASSRACPTTLRDQILDRAEGVPLYAVETVRMLLDRGCSCRRATATGRPARSRTLEVPETLHALIAARLDGLASRGAPARPGRARCSARRSRKPALAASSGCRRRELEPLLAALVRKEVLALQADPRSPERGQYGFLQDLVRHVAYETLSRRERKARHLAAAAHLEHGVRGRGRGRRGARLALPRRLRRGARRRRRGRDQARPGRCSRAPASAPRRSPPARRRSATSSRPPSSPTTSRTAAELLDAPGRWPALPAGRCRGTRPLLERVDRALREAGETRRGRAVASARSATVDFASRATSSRPRRASTRPSRHARRRSRRGASSQPTLGAARTGAGAERVEREHALVIARARTSSSPRRLAARRVLAQALTSKALASCYGRPLRQGVAGSARGRGRARRRARANAACVPSCGQPQRHAPGLGRSSECMEFVDSIEARARHSATGSSSRRPTLRLRLVLIALGRWDEALERPSRRQTVSQASASSRSAARRPRSCPVRAGRARGGRGDAAMPTMDARGGTDRDLAA